MPTNRNEELAGRSEWHQKNVIGPFLRQRSLKLKLQRAARKKLAKANRRTPWNSIIRSVDVTIGGLRYEKMLHATKGKRRFRRL